MGEPDVEPLLSRAQLEELELRWRQQGTPVVEHLRAGLKADEIEQLMAPLELTLPVEAQTWWGWRDGVPASDVESPVERSMGGPDFEFLPLAEAVEQYRRQRRLAADAAEFSSSPEMPIDYWWNPSWFPLTPTRYGGVVACDCRAAPDGPTPLRMVHWGGKEDFDQPMCGSMGTMVGWWIDALDRGAWRYSDTERRWLLDYSRLTDPALELTRLV